MWALCGIAAKRRQSGQSRPELGISKEGDSYLRKRLVQGAHHALGPFGLTVIYADGA